MSKFCPAYKILRPLEGYYSKLQNDLGGESYGGVSRKNWPYARIWPMVDKEKPLSWNQKLKDERAEGLLEIFYFTNFWGDIPLVEISEQKVATYIFCQRVNMGKTIVRLVQGIEGLKRDGIMGDKTINAINNDKEILPKLIKKNINYYKDLARERPSQRSNLDGWLNRIDKLNAGKIK